MAVRDVSGALVGELRRAEATELARDGNYEGAVRLLDGLDDDPATWTLLAKIHAQRGDLAGAEQAWRRALAVSPDDPQAREGLAVTTAILEGRKRRRPLPVRAVGAGGAAVVAAVVAAALVVPGLVTDTDPTAGPAPVPASSKLPGPTASTTSTAGTDRQAAERAWSRETAERLAGPGVRVEDRQGEVHVVFEEGLFLPDLARLTAGGRETLTRVARRLTGLDVRVSVVGHGVVVTGGPRTGGSTVALARASEAARILAETARQPMTRFTVRSAEQSDKPHPGNGEADRARNRTVTLLVTPAGP